MQCVSISDDKNLTIELLDFGARIHRIDFNGIDVALSYPDVSDYLTDPYYLGASVGPIANRIADGKLTIEGASLQMPLNEGDNSLHSGGLGFDKETWSMVAATKNSVEYQLVFDLNRVGLLGRLVMTASYHVERGTLTIEYRAKSDTSTYINPTNHVYLNLAGSGNVADHQFEVLADSYLAVNEFNLPTGQATNLEPPLAYQILNSSIFEFAGGCDHHFNINEASGTKILPMLKASSEDSGICLLVSGNSPGFQFYTGKFLSAPFLPSAGFCVETQFAPDAINQANFFSPLLEAGDEHRQTTVFEFSSMV